MLRVSATTSAFIVIALCAQRAHAGGFEMPDNGTQAVGRGAAFVAKANDPTAIYHNPAGLAQQRGTNLLINGNLYIHSFEFQRLGEFKDDPQDPATPWGTADYPLVKNIAGPFFAPFIALATDFGYFDRLTIGAGVYGPPVVGNRTFPLGVEGKPAASRYDFVQSRSTLIFPTLSAGVRVLPWLDLGVSTHLVLAKFDQTTVSYADLGAEVCKKPEYFLCDTRNTLNASGTSFGATFGAMIRPADSYAFGLTFRTPINVTAKGTVTPTSPGVLADAEDQDLTPGDATLRTQLPWMLRLGGRYIGMDRDFELYDLELNITYEGWGSSQADGPIVDIPKLGPVENVQTVVLHRYKNTFGLRAGGAYNIDTGEGILSIRAGAYYDSSATDFAHTRLDFDTLAKVAGTFGLGFKLGSVGFDLGYAAVASVPRLVGSNVGEIRPINGLKGGATVDANDDPLGAVNEGSYRGFTHLVSLGISMSIDSFFGPPRKIHYGNPWEPNYAEEGASDEKKPEEETKKKPIEEEKKDKEDEDKKKADEEKKKAEEEKKKADEEKKKPPKEDDEEKPPKKKPPKEDDEEKPPPKKKPPKEDDEEEKPSSKKKPPTPPPPPVEEPKPKPPPPPKEEKPPSKRKEWWEDPD